MHRWLAIVALVGTAHAGPEDGFRQVQLTDGRTLHGQVLSSDQDGVRLRLVQGETVVPFHLVQAISPIEEAEALAAPPWSMLVVGSEPARRTVQRIASTLPHVIVNGDDLTSAVEQSSACAENDFPCVVALAPPGLWVVSVEMSPKGSWILRGGVSSGDTWQRTEVRNPASMQSLADALDPLLGLRSANRASGALASTSVPRAPASRTGVTSVGASFVPIPGYPALKRGNAGDFGLSLAATAAPTAAWIGVTGTHSQALIEHVALSAGGYYVTTVIVNHLVARGKAPAISVAPRPGGAHVVVGGTLR